MTTIKSLKKDYKEKRKTPIEVIEKALANSTKANKLLNIFITIAESEARKRVKNLKVGKDLSGIPIVVKDNFSTYGIKTTASAKLLDNYVPVFESTVTQKLLDNGAVIIGKTNMDAWAHGSSTETSDYGTTLNPYDLTRVPGGSSGGSSSAVAAGICPFAIGSETAGSIRQPASWCGVVGLKPTYGRVSRYGLIAMGSSLDSPGPITKTVNDAALLLQVIAGKDKYDATTSSKPVPNYTSEMKKNRKFVIGISDDYLENVDRSVVLEFERLISILKKSGHKLKKIKLINPKYAISLYTILHRAEVSSNLARFDGVRFGHNRSSFAKQAKRRMTLGAYALSVGYYDQYYLKAQKVRTLIINNFIEAFKSVDLIFAPTTPTTALKVGESEGNPMFGEMMDVLVEASSIAGLPGINIPTTIASGLPVGMQIFGPWFEEGKILDLSFQLQNELEFYNFKPKNYYGI